MFPVTRIFPGKRRMEDNRIISGSEKKPYSGIYSGIFSKTSPIEQCNR